MSCWPGSHPAARSPAWRPPDRSRAVPRPSCRMRKPARSRSGGRLTAPIHLEQERCRSRHVHEAPSFQQSHALVRRYRAGDHPAHQSFGDEIGRETKLVCVAARRGGEVDRPLAELILHDLQHRQVRAHQIRASQPGGVERDRDRPEIAAGRLHQRQVVRQRVGGVAQIVPAHPGCGRAWPSAAAVQLGCGARIECHRGSPLQLPKIPTGVRERQHEHAHVLADALDLLRVPQWEGVVVARGHQDRVGIHRLQQVAGVVTRQGFAVAGSGESVGRERD